MDIFRGNMSDSDTLKENLDGFKKEYGVARTVVVADKGMNCSHNIDPKLPINYTHNLV